MKKLMLKCPHCTTAFDLWSLISSDLRATLIESLELNDVERARIHEDVLADVAQTHRLQTLEHEKLISDLRHSIHELQLKATRGSQQRSGETFEAEIFEQLRARFIEDKVTRVGKGKNGGDIIHEVRDEQGRTVSKVLWELKNTTTWSPKWIEKVRVDARKCGATICVIITRSLPKEIVNFGEVEGVWVTNGVCHVGVALALRAQLLACARIRTELTDAARLDALSAFITGPEFKEHVAAIASAVTALHNQVERERQFFERHWAERMMLAATIRQGISMVTGGLEGIPRIVSQCIQSPTESTPKNLESHNPGNLIDRV